MDMGVIMGAMEEWGMQLQCQQWDMEVLVEVMVGDMEE